MQGLEEEDTPTLSEREREVVHLIASGLSAKEVAQKICLSPRTVEHHLENIRHKLRAKNRAHIITKAVAFGELDLPVH